jgi:hypothetical protein
VDAVTKPNLRVTAVLLAIFLACWGSGLVAGLFLDAPLPWWLIVAATSLPLIAGWRARRVPVSREDMLFALLVTLLIVGSVRLFQ